MIWREVDKDKIKLTACTTDKDMKSVARHFHVSSAYVTEITERVKFKAVLCWKGENHTFYRHAKTRAQALSMAKRGLEKVLGLKTFSLRAHYDISYTDICSCVPCICHTCLYITEEGLCYREGVSNQVSSLYSCHKWEDKRK